MARSARFSRLKAALPRPGHPALYVASALLWTLAALVYSPLLPVFPIFIVFMLLGVWLVPTLIRRRP